jgi:hypothetical protein
MAPYKASFQRNQIADNHICPIVRFKNCVSRNEQRHQKISF